jgi:5-methyltetrahydrofolate--homocysteine methyltransferase
VKVIVGGAPLSEEFAQSIGADGYAYDAANAVEKVLSLVAED